MRAVDGKQEINLEWPYQNLKCLGIPCFLTFHCYSGSCLQSQQLPARVLKLCAEQISPVLQIIFSQSLEYGTLPQDWLSANITPVFKKGNRNIPGNYRPISLTSLPCKVMEHIIFHHIMNHFDTLNILNPLQHGFRPNHSCQSQLISFVEDIQFSMNNHKLIYCS